MVREEEIINDVVYNLRRLTNLEDIVFKTARQSKSYGYSLTINGVTFACDVRPQVNKANYNLVVQHMRSLKEQTDKPLMLVANHFSPESFEGLPEEGVSVVESSGNCNIVAAPMFIRISGQKAMLPKEAKGKAFNEAGLKVIFYLLLDEININKPYRTIHEETGVSLGTIKNVIEELGRGKFVLTTENGRFLKNRKELLDVWQTHYNQSLKPKLLLKEMEFVDADCRRDWNKIILPDGMCWGGEGGAFLIDRYLMPELFDIYTETPSVKLMMTKKVKFQEKGRIKLYQKFWKDNTDEKTAPKILIYADLMGSGNSRCIEAAQRLIENGI